ncbi:MAG: rod shape-determining protein MreC [Muribaculaceae bacterium]|nr:rod shape-determining protein MreC [Muribaculaceae bacterium]
MRSLLDFLVRRSPVMVFLIYVILSCVLLFDHNPYQHHVYMTSAGAVASSVYEKASTVSSYFNLRDINEDLQLRNASLEAEVIGLRNMVRTYTDSIYADTVTIIPELQPFKFTVAHVINNSISKPYNYITLDRGELDGIAQDMGVVDQNGVVGLVNLTGPHNARVLSLLNLNFMLSCRVKDTETFGSLTWDGDDYRYAVLEELPKHTVFEIGDTVVTTGYSGTFPENVPVGIIEGTSPNSNDNFYTLKVRLLTDFSQLSTVRVVDNTLLKEIRDVELRDLPHEDPDNIKK